MIHNYTYTIHDVVVLRRIYEIEIIVILVAISTQVCEEPQTVRLSVTFHVGTLEKRKPREDSFQLQESKTINFLKTS